MIKDKQPYHILLVEDNAGDFAIEELLLTEQMQQPTIVQAENFKQAQAILSNSANKFDVILLDLSLPDKSGQSLVAEMLGIAGTCPIIILTGFSDIDFSIQSIAQGVSDYILKDDLSATTLYKSIIYALERKKNNAALKDSQKRYSDLFHLSPTPMWLYSPETLGFVQVNQATINCFGYSEAELLKMPILDLLAPKEHLKTDALINLYKQMEKAQFKGVFVLHKKNGAAIDVEIFSNPITINEKKLRAVLAIDITEKNQQEHKITAAIIKAQEQERYEIGGELHDNVCQILASSLMTLGLLKSHIPPAKIPYYNQSKDCIAMALEEIRNLSHHLAPAFFDDSALNEEFNKLLTTFNKNDRYKIVLQFEPAVLQQTLKRDIQLNLYRILQEQLSNIVKYANASCIEVKVNITDGLLEMMIKDDGVGFTVEDAKDGIGLANMKRRAELFYGHFNIESSPGNGCKLEVTIPLSKNKLN